ncbi:MAG: DNA cytosine methyltransferase [Raoultibacter sp.]
MIIKPPSMKEINAKEKPWRGMSFFAGCGGSSTGHKMAGINIILSNEFVDAARESYEANHPTTKVLPHDIRRLDPKKLLQFCGLNKYELDLLDGSPPCFTEDTLIHTADGMKFISDMNVGDMAMTSTGKYYPVYDTMVRPYTGTMHRIETLLGSNTATPEHPFYVRRQQPDGSYSDPFWCDAKDVQEQDLLGTPRTTPDMGAQSYHDQIAMLHPQIWHWSVLPEFWWMVGHWCSRGTLESILGVNVVNFESHTNQENALIEQAFDVLKLSSINRIETSTAQRKTFRVVMDSDLVQFLRTFISQDSNKFSRRLPAMIFHLAPELKQQFILGYIGRDYVSAMGTSQLISSDSRRFLVEMNYLCCSAFNRPLFDGMIFSDLNFGSALTPKERTGHKEHVGYVLLQDEHHFFHEFGQDDPHIWTEVIENLAFHTTCNVYNFSVETDETYVANSVVVHNCKGFSTAGVKEEGWGKEVKYSDNKYQQVDDLFDQYCRMLKGMMPKVFTAENVSGLVKGASKGYFIEIMNTFDELGYYVRAPLLNAAWLGVPQTRERIIFMGVRKDVAHALGYKTAKTAVPDVVPCPSMAFLADALPHIMRFKSTQKDIIKYLPAINGAMPTITAADAIAYETARFSSAGFIEDNKGQRRKLTIDELKVISGLPSDYVLTGKFEQQWERLGRICVPAMTEAASKALIEHVLIPYAKKRKKKPGDIFK